MAQNRRTTGSKPRGNGTRATGTRAPKRGAPPPSGINLTPAQQEQVVAISLFAIALLTALGAYNLSGGNILDGWTRLLGLLFGWGRVLAPIFFAGLGVWLLLDSLDRRPDVGWERPLGLVLLFLFLLTVFHVPYSGPDSLKTAEHGDGGGMIGYWISDFLVGGIGLAGTLFVLAIVLFIGLLLLFNIPLTRIGELMSGVVRELQLMFSTRRMNGSSRRRSNGRTPIEMVTAPPRDSTTNRRSSTSPTLSGDDDDAFSSYEPLPAARPTVAARIVGGSAAFQSVHREWRLPRIEDILEESIEQDISAQEIRTKVRQIEETLAHFGVPAKVVEVNQGPTITQFGVEPGFLDQKGADGTARKTKVKVNRISALQHDLELALAAAPIRVEAPVPGKPIVGIEVPNSQVSRVSLRGVMESEEFQKLEEKSKLAFALGQDVSGQPSVANLGTMPHLLIAGATGSGKSVCVNALIACLLMTNTPDDLKLVMVDPKRVELSAFNGIPHLLAPVVVEMDLAVAALQRTVQEMDERYKKFSAVGARNIEGYNALTDDKRRGPKLPYLVLVVDELADLMMVAPEEVERAITRLAQMARATGVHLVLATQRPSVDVVTGLIKANFPSRISFAVTSQIDSRVVLDTPGAEKLLGRGDMLYMASDSSKLTRLQGCFVSDRELEKLVAYWKGFIETPIADESARFSGGPGAPLARVAPSSVIGPSSDGWVQGGLWSDLAAKPKSKSEEDELFDQALIVIQQSDRASISLLQRKLRIGYSRAAKLMELLEQKGMVGPDEGTAKGREILTKGRMASTSRASTTPSSSRATAPQNNREFEGADDDDFDDWTDEDWADLDKG